MSDSDAKLSARAQRTSSPCGSAVHDGQRWDGEVHVVPSASPARGVVAVVARASSSGRRPRARDTPARGRAAPITGGPHARSHSRSRSSLPAAAGAERLRPLLAAKRAAKCGAGSRREAAVLDLGGVKRADEASASGHDRRSARSERGDPMPLSRIAHATGGAQPAGRSARTPTSASDSRRRRDRPPYLDALAGGALDITARSTPCGER